MDLNDKYEELSELVAGIEDLVNKIEDVTYIEQLNGIKEEGIEVKKGEFGEDMLVEINNDGPVTIIYDTNNKE